jgi:methanogenic corrinoid protein MtbC1
MKQAVQQNLNNLLDLTETIATRLNSETMDSVITLLKERREVLDCLATDEFRSALRSCLQHPDQNDGNAEQTRTIIQHILQLDKQNMEVITQKIEQTSDMITELAREQEAVKKWRVIARNRPKQIVDFLY